METPVTETRIETYALYRIAGDKRELEFMGHDWKDTEVKVGSRDPLLAFARAPFDPEGAYPVYFRFFEKVIVEVTYAGTTRVRMPDAQDLYNASGKYYMGAYVVTIGDNERGWGRYPEIEEFGRRTQATHVVVARDNKLYVFDPEVDHIVPEDED